MVSECPWNQGHEKKCPGKFVFSLRERTRPRIFLVLLTWPKIIRHSTRCIPLLYLYLLKLTVNITSCSAFFSNKNEKGFALLLSSNAWSSLVILADLSAHLQGRLSLVGWGGLILHWYAFLNKQSKIKKKHGCIIEMTQGKDGWHQGWWPDS